MVHLNLVYLSEDLGANQILHPLSLGKPHVPDLINRMTH